MPGTRREGGTWGLKETRKEVEYLLGGSHIESTNKDERTNKNMDGAAKIEHAHKKNDGEPMSASNGSTI